MSLLRLSGVTADYGPTQVLFGVDLTLGEGEVLALMGRNGMGKTTTVRVITRLLAHRDGEVRFTGADLAGKPPYRAAQMGLGLVPEGRRCFRGLTVGENLLVAARPGEWDMARVTALLPRLGERLGQDAASLSGGEQQMLAIGRALMTNPRLLILDEATEGLAPVLRQEIWTAIAGLRQETRLAILVIDKTLDELRRIADNAVILERGRTVWSGAFAGLTPELTDRYLGV